MQYQFNKRIKAASNTDRPQYFYRGSMYMSEHGGPSLEAVSVHEPPSSTHPSANLTAQSMSKASGNGYHQP